VQHNCDLCDFVAKKESALNTHIERDHPEKDLKFQLCAIVKSIDFDDTEVRKQVIENLNKHKEIETIRRKIFKSCNLLETKHFRNGRITKEEFLRFKNETGWTTYF
jgi:hypothetical protein